MIYSKLSDTLDLMFQCLYEVSEGMDRVSFDSSSS